MYTRRIFNLQRLRPPSTPSACCLSSQLQIPIPRLYQRTLSTSTATSTSTASTAAAAADPAADAEVTATATATATTHDVTRNYTRLEALRRTIRAEYPVGFSEVLELPLLPPPPTIAAATATATASASAPTATASTATSSFPRLEALRKTLSADLSSEKPFSSFLTDRFKRQHTYLRISITERCNLRCLYCMPEDGISLSPADHLLSTNEIIELARLFIKEGVTKIRLTGGEPTVRKDIVELVRRLGELKPLGLREIAITSNGISLLRKLPDMVEAGLTAVNLSLDTLVPPKFEMITRRRGLEKVLMSMEEALRLGIRVKVNMVVMKGVNEEELADFVELTKERNVEVRFIEYMPFDGNKWASKKMFSFQQMLDVITRHHPGFYLLPQLPNDTAKTYAIPGYKGTVGFITSMTENFCGTCNRLRITSDGNIKACLFGNEEVSLRDVMREYRKADEEVGAGGEKREEMEKRLLEVIGGAVGRKEEGHKPADVLAREGGNRPMILIDKRMKKSISGVTGVKGVLESSSFTSFTSPSSSSSSFSSSSWNRNIPVHLLPPISSPFSGSQLRFYSSSNNQNIPPFISPATQETQEQENRLPHLTSDGSAHMVSIHHKLPTTRTAIASGTITFSNPIPLQQIRSNSNKKGDVLGLARISGIMAAKKCPEIVVLCHPILLTRVGVEVEVVEGSGSSEPRAAGECGEFGGVKVIATVTCEGKTGVEMEALTAVMGAALAVVDMCKAVDKNMVIGQCRVVQKTGGKKDFYLGEN
ncbi:hypothetical protein BZA77DRAFT_388486 [Pyronema omphalodes]|nr:hypothetical protein BZA77DRAFT_388486 [Pyronema omphalodes]